MSDCYYSYSFYLDDGLIMEEILDENIASPMRAVGLEPPLDFDDYIDVWKSVCFPIFEVEADEDKLSTKYFREAYKRGEKKIYIDLEHNPLKSTYAAKYTRVSVIMSEDEAAKRVCVHVYWADNPELEMKMTAVR